MRQSPRTNRGIGGESKEQWMRREAERKRKLKSNWETAVKVASLWACQPACTNASVGFCISHAKAEASRHMGTLLISVLYSCAHVGSLSVVPTSVTC